MELVSSALCQRQRRPARKGVELSRALLSNWVDACCQLMIQLNEWMVEKNGSLSKKSRLGEVFSYVLNQWEALCYYSDDGLAEADNNTAERALRAVCLGKRITCSLATIM
ncbi:hypothetical protein WR17_22870 [Escherichia coli]|nr:hypothetical protein HW43_24215 [Escherichia coli]KFV25679.1 hypothetical protein GS38_22495 [Escherichia coli]KLH24493.1 hypothetical protein WR17_22870 [Escherichia coli]KLH89986.1 hypothetical protein WR18_23050 [Escherichia coli]KNY59749.1 hypothetical protein AGA22_19885 [Escherichia coli]